MSRWQRTVSSVRIPCICSTSKLKLLSCQRMNKTCEPAVTRTTARASKKRAALSATTVSKHHIEKLEEKVDGLVLLLKSSRDNGESRESPAAITPALSSLNGVKRDNGSLLVASSGLLGQANHQIQPNPFSASDADATPSCAEPTNLPPATTAIRSESQANDQIEEEEKALTFFRDKMSPHFPFIIVRSTAQELRRERPFLLQAILAVSSQIPSQQLVLGNEIAKTLMDMIFVKGERSLDLLLAVLTYAGL
jgi:hypothetical protein